MKLYRYVLRPKGEFNDVELYVREFIVQKETPGGYWIRDSWEYKKRWVAKTNRYSKKRYAYADKEKALVNYIKRTEKRLSILKHQVTYCAGGLIAAKKLQDENNI